MSNNKKLTLWLSLVIVLIVLMVSLGGITRLTQSGLSMVEWKPVTGIIPPTSEASWMLEFEKYQSSPEFKKINTDMSLEGFKQIYFWEFFHRLFGRLIGLVYFLPFLFFIFRGYFKENKSMQLKLWGGFLLGGAQGGVGWFMVKSGLVNAPHVSHYRLAAHLMLAFFIIAYLLWQILEINKDKLKPQNLKLTSWQKKMPQIVLLFLAFQIFYGALTAGLKAGYAYNTYPKMSGLWIPKEIYNLGINISAFFETAAGVQWTHRHFAVFVLILAIINAILSLTTSSKLIKTVATALLVTVVIQFILGILTLVMHVPIPIAVTHQVMAIILLSLTVAQIKISKLS
ncbi:COX15/CtaA family protein [bacterium]|nr:COX15/CtaA family protein [bacterium]